jgi:hypothetical protein
MQLLFSGARTAIRNITVPATSKIYIVNNATTGGFAVIVKTGVSTGVSIGTGEKAVIAYNGSDFVKIASSLISGLSGILPVANGGTNSSSLATITVGNATTAATATNIAGGAANQVAFQTGASTTAFAPAPTVAGLVLGWTGSAFSWVSAPAATSATNLAGGGANTVVYQSSVGTTAYLTNGLTGQVLLANTGAAPTWGTITNSVTSFQTSLSGLTPSTSTTGGITLAGTLGTSSGGTNSTATPTAGTIAYGTGSAYAFSTLGPAGYLLTSGGSGAPTWTDTATLGTSNGRLYFFGQF